MSRIEQLPPHIKKPLDAKLRAGEPQKDILAWLEEPVREEGLEPISRSGLNRYATKTAEFGAELRQMRAMASAWKASLGDEPEGDILELAGEVLGTVAFKAAHRARDATIEDEDAPIDPKALNQFALALRRLQQAQESGLKREKALREAHARKMAEASAAAGNAARKAGLSEEGAAAIRAVIEGVA
ncbi:MAG: DUF3486 family protein [Gemmatimonadota bacterium]|nr:DUF3486 family protein [Gemmatimonadota bacterium]